MLTRIDVTQEDIDKGVPGSRCGCPIALAGIRALNKSVYVGVSPRRFTIHSSHDQFAYLHLPYNAKLFVICFDNETPVSPFSFELDIPEWALAVAG